MVAAMVIAMIAVMGWLWLLSSSMGKRSDNDGYGYGRAK